MGLAKVADITDIADIADILQIYCGRLRQIVVDYGEKWQIIMEGVIGHIP